MFSACLSRGCDKISQAHTGRNRTYDLNGYGWFDSHNSSRYCVDLSIHVSIIFRLVGFDYVILLLQVHSFGPLCYPLNTNIEVEYWHVTLIFYTLWVKKELLHFTNGSMLYLHTYNNDFKKFKDIVSTYKNNVSCMHLINFKTVIFLAIYRSLWTSLYNTKIKGQQLYIINIRVIDATYILLSINSLSNASVAVVYCNISLDYFYSKLVFVSLFIRIDSLLGFRRTM